MRNVTIVGQAFPVAEDTDAADMAAWCDSYTTALKNAFAANPSSAFPVPTAANEGQVMKVTGGAPVWAAAPSTGPTVRAGTTRVTTDQFGTATITLPGGVFTATPVVVVSNATWGPARPFHIEVSTATSSSVTVVIKPDTANTAVAVGAKAVDVSWIAATP